MPRLIAIVLVALMPLLSLAQQELVFEAEDVSSPPEAWGKDITPTDRWNLWSKDKDAEVKWSGGKVMQSPQVMQDREKPEDGAPVLHVVLKDIPDGRYQVLLKFGRALAASVDQENWIDLSKVGGELGRFDVTGGKFEFWVDDRFADANSPGSTYFDNVRLIPLMAEKNGVTNGDFQVGKDMPGSGWIWFSREQKGGVAFSDEGRNGSRCALLTHEGARDYAFTNAGRLNVEPGQTWVASAWMKCENTDSADLDIVALSGGRLVSWNIGSDGVYGTTDWKKVQAEAYIPQGVDQIHLRVVGSGNAKVWIDDVALEASTTPQRVRLKGPVNGWAQERVEEKISRGLVALPREDGSVYVGWRLLKSDPADIAFNVYRAAGRMVPVKITEQPVTRTTDFVDKDPPRGIDFSYWVKPVVDGREGVPSDQAFLPADPKPTGYVSIKLDGDYTFQKCGIADLNGDGRYDYVLKQPGNNIDPYQGYWTPSPESYKLEAYTDDGTFLWRKDLGWAIERGIWYSPYLVLDFDGDGRAEVAVKTGEGDPRDPDGRVRTGPEYISILDGMTGEEKARADWPSRQGFGGGLSGYNYASRNQLGVGYLDGKTPCLLVARGTYTVMKVDAYQYHDGKLELLWSFDSRDEAGRYAGQGAHFMHSADVDGDGRDEVILGSSVIDDDGKGLWTTGLGHPDKCYVGDIDPDRPGMEIFYVIEPQRKENGVCLVDAATGEIIWGTSFETFHVGSGMAADIDPTKPGMECWASEDPKGDPAGLKYNNNPPRWIFSASGELLGQEEKVPSMITAYWDADGLRELVGGGRIYKYRGQTVAQGIQGSQVIWADVLGDWREEIITSVQGEMRIYSTTIPATDRRVCLMQDPIYRIDTANNAMGYNQPPMTSYFMGQSGAVLWMDTGSASIRFGQEREVKVVLEAPAKQAVQGTIALTGSDDLTIEPAQAAVSAPAGGKAEAIFAVSLRDKPDFLAGVRNLALTATLTAEESLEASASLRVGDELPDGSLVVEAESFTSQEGGEVQIREDKVGHSGKSFSHWDAAGHALTWSATVPADGEYMLVVRYCSTWDVDREIAIDGGQPVRQRFVSTGGFSSTSSDWLHAPVKNADGKTALLSLKAGEHIIRMTNTDGKGMNLDYIALVPMG